MSVDQSIDSSAKSSDQGQNNSLIQKVVENFLPHKLSRWFSTSVGQQKRDGNGNTPRKRESSSSDDDESPTEVRTDTTSARPPTKRYKITTQSEHNSSFEDDIPPSSPSQRQSRGRVQSTIAVQRPYTGSAFVNANANLPERYNRNAQIALNRKRKHLQSGREYFERPIAQNVFTTNVTLDINGKSSTATATTQHNNDDNDDNSLSSISESNDSYNIGSPMHHRKPAPFNFAPQNTGIDQLTRRSLSSSNSKLKQLWPLETSEVDFSKHLQTRKSLFSYQNMTKKWSTSNASLNTSISDRPSSVLSDTSSFNTNSPFYNGQIAYGGASSYNNRDSPMNRSLRVPIQIRPSPKGGQNNLQIDSDGQQSSGGGLSSTAKRILDVLDQFTTPLTDAKKMTCGRMINASAKLPSLVGQRKRFCGGPHDQTAYDRANGNVRLANNCNQQRNKSSSLEQPYVGAAAHELQVPSMSQLLQMKKLLTNTVQVKQIVAESTKSSISDENTRNRNQLFELQNVRQFDSKKQQDPINHQTKVAKPIEKISDRKVNETKVSGGGGGGVESGNTIFKKTKSSPANENLMKWPIENQASIVMQANSIPNGLQGGAQLNKINNNNKTNTNNNNKKCNIYNEAFSTPVTHQFDYKFAMPIHIKPPAKSSSEFKTRKMISPFAFGSPMAIEKHRHSRIEGITSKKTPSRIGLDMGFRKLADKGNMWECEICMVRNKEADTKCVACTSVCPKQKSTATVSNIAPLVDDTFKKLIAAQGSGWACDVCMVNNKVESSKCVACTSERKIVKKSIESVNVAATPLVDNTFKKLIAAQSNGWTCNVCMINNKIESNNCAACTSIRPSTQQLDQKLPPLHTADEGFKKLVADQNSKGWSCSACFVTNKNDANKCVACGNQNSLKKTTKQPTAPLVASDETFKKIVAEQSQKWSCSSCLTSNASHLNNCACCKEQKPGTIQNTSSVPKFTFGMGSAVNSTKVMETDSDKNGGIDTSVATNGFIFGNSKIASGLFFDSEKITNKMKTETSGFGLIGSVSGGPSATAVAVSATATTTPSWTFGTMPTTSGSLPSTFTNSVHSSSNTNNESELLKQKNFFDLGKVANKSTTEQMINSVAAPIATPSWTFGKVSSDVPAPTPTAAAVAAAPVGNTMSFNFGNSAPLKSNEVFSFSSPTAATSSSSSFAFSKPTMISSSNLGFPTSTPSLAANIMEPVAPVAPIFALTNNTTDSPPSRKSARNDLNTFSYNKEDSNKPLFSFGSGLLQQPIQFNSLDNSSNQMFSSHNTSFRIPGQNPFTPATSSMAIQQRRKAKATRRMNPMNPR